MHGSNFIDWPTQSNLILEVVKEPLRANAEPILLLPFSAQSYIEILDSERTKQEITPTQAAGFSC